MLEICNPIECTGCSACIGICHQHAISMISNEEGFQYPKIDNDRCIDCGLCKEICPTNRASSTSSANLQQSQQPYLAYINDVCVRLDSSSGGLFTAIAKYVLQQDGVVCGAAYDKDMTVRHCFVEKEEDLPILRGSKYVQSLLGDVFLHIKEYLKKGRMVYFVGTPCQVAGLKSYLRKTYDNLLTSDLVCHGVPSGHLFKEQIKHLENSIGKPISGVNFRSKRRFGQGYDFEVITKHGQSLFYCAELIPFFYGFWTNRILRESCYQCHYTSLSREGDITLADFWLVKKCFPDIKTSKGTSLILVNSPKGASVIAKLVEQGVIYARTATIEQAMMGQGQLKCPVPRPVERNKYKKYEDFSMYCHSLLKPSLGYKIKMHLRNTIKLLILYKYWK